MQTLNNGQEKSIDTPITMLQSIRERCRHPSTTTALTRLRRHRRRKKNVPSGARTRDLAISRWCYVRRTTSFPSSGQTSPESCSLVGHGCLPPLSGRLRVRISGDNDPRHPVFHLKSAAPLLALQTVLRVPAFVLFFSQVPYLASKPESGVNEGCEKVWFYWY